MAYFNIQNKPSTELSEELSENKDSSFEDIARAGIAGLLHGLSGKHMTYEQWLREKRRKQQGFPSKKRNWLQKILD